MPKIESSKDAAEFFPSFNNRDFLVSFYLFLEKHGLQCIEIEFFVAIFGLLLTIIHVFILTRKRMMMSSIISVMIGIGFCDGVNMALAISLKHMIPSFYNDEW
uniref:G_PROTEIN_RECEP_F1_2 domain-containing protein n=1 Tax=Caenorhabditis tropicalis TaxID=1561998 RepID=A0A1I7V2L8_9PELO